VKVMQVSTGSTNASGFGGAGRRSGKTLPESVFRNYLVRISVDLPAVRNENEDKDILGCYAVSTGKY
jgi:hypothetical protein